MIRLWVTDGVIFIGENKKDPSICQKNYINWYNILDIKLTLNKGVYLILIERIMYIAIRFYNKALIKFYFLINKVIRYKTYSEL